MKRKKITVVTGTRAEYGLLRSTMDAILKEKSLSLQVIVTGPHTLEQYGNTQNEITKDGYPVVAVVPIEKTEFMYEALAIEIQGIGQYLQKNRPDCVLILGDRDEVLAAALAAAHLKIPIAHIHGGDRSGYVIDEPIRHSITKFAHLHFAICPSSVRRILQLGEEPWRVHLVGAPGFDEMVNAPMTSRENVAKQLGLDSARRWILVAHHPTINDQTPLRKQIQPLLAVLNDVYKEDEKIIIYPNSDAGSEVFIQEIEKNKKNPRMHVFKNLPREQYLSALRHAVCIVGNSSSGIIESGAYHVPSLTVGGRQSNRERGKNVLESDYDKESLQKNLVKVLTSAFKKMASQTTSPYGNGGVGSKVATLLSKLVHDPRLLQKEFCDIKKN